LPLKHSTTMHASSPYACFIICNVSLADLPHFCQNLTFCRSSNCNILDFRCSHTTTLHSSDFLSKNTEHMQLFFAGTREKRAWHHLVAPCI
jgi:hypothetical protein